MRRRLLVLLVTVSVVLAAAPFAGVGVAAGASGPLGDVDVSGKPGERPSVVYDWPLSVRSSVWAVRTKGTGTPKARPGDRVTIDYLILNGRTGEPIDTSYGATPATLTLAKGTTPALRRALVGTSAGSRVVVAVAPEDGLTKNRRASGLKKNDTVLFVVDVTGVSAPLRRATGKAVAPVAGLPVVKLDKRGAPTITMPKGAPPSELVVQPLIVGTGPVVTAGQTVDVQYTGAIWKTGKVFDSSWTGSGSVQFPIGVGQVVAGWDEGLVGQTVGSQVLLVLPPEKGYGASGQPAAGIKGTDTLVFVVDILGAA